MRSEDSDRLIEEELGFAGPPRPDEPVLLGEFTAEEAEAMGAFDDEAAAGAPELRGLGGRVADPASPR